MAAAITLQKTRHAANGLAQVIFVRQEHQAEMVPGCGRLKPVPCTSGTFLPATVRDEFLIVGDQGTAGSRRRHIQRGLGLTQRTPEWR